MEPTQELLAQESKLQFKLTANQQRVFETVEKNHHNILVCGKPGVGKSVLIRALTETGDKSYTLAAPTGLAALNINGKTLHSLFRLPVSGGIVHPTFNKFPTDDRVLNHIRFGIKHLIIDEISMVRADMFDYLDRLCRFAKGVDKPFGGIQIIAIGDFYQLPPVVVKEEKKQMEEAGYKSPFVFDSRVFPGNFAIMELNEVLRQQGDPTFIDVLDRARDGQLLPRDCAILNLREGVEGDTGLKINLTGTNSLAAEVNRIRLAALSDPKTYTASKFGDWPALPTEEVLQLAVGAQVIVKKNRADVPAGIKDALDSAVVNGTVGIVKQLENDKVLIEMESKDEVWIYRQTWERKIKERIGEDWEERVVASFTQIPLALAWAISIHKSQGQTFERVKIDTSRIFAAGQLYVALSRCKSLNGIYLQGAVTTRKCWADRNVIRFANQYLS